MKLTAYFSFTTTFFFLSIASTFFSSSLKGLTRTKDVMFSTNGYGIDGSGVLRVQHWHELTNVSSEFRSEEDVHKVEVTHEKPAKFVDKVC